MTWSWSSIPSTASGLVEVSASRIEPAERIGIDLTQQHIEHMMDRDRPRLTMPRPQLIRVGIAWRSELGVPVP
jgi:hypothetical protein